MKTIVIGLVFFVGFLGCGGSGGESGDINEQPGSHPVQLLCSHNGDLWLCPEGPGSCIRDQSSVEEGSSIDSGRQYLIKESEGKARFYLKLSSGAITIIAECGSNVTFSNSEETEANPSTVVTTATANLGVNGSTPEAQ